MNDIETNFVDFNDPHVPAVSCYHCNILKNGFIGYNADVESICGCIPSNLCFLLTVITNIFFTPYLLVYHFCRIYLIPAIYIFISNIIIYSCCLINFCKCSYYDIDFPPTDLSIGKDDNNNKYLKHTISNLDCWKTGICHAIQLFCCRCFINKQKIEWKRAIELSPNNNNMKLFQGDIEPNDVLQGQTGDCWLLATIAAAADRDGLIENLFISRSKSECGYYKLKLYDHFNDNSPSWKIFTIDDKIPVNNNTNKPLYAQPNGSELFVLLLEKAFGKMLGNYNRLDGGHEIDAMYSFTGNIPVRYNEIRKGIEYKNSYNRYNSKIMAPNLNREQLWKVISNGCIQRMLITAGINGKGNEKSIKYGLISGHAYSVLSCYTTKATRLIQLRNPWGKGEYNGPYSDSDNDPTHVLDTKIMEWKGKKINNINDGIFWMPWDEFIDNFNSFDLCAVSTGMETLELNINEDYGTCGICLGVIQGCGSYCLLCKGTRQLWCNESRSTIEMINDFKNGLNITDTLGNISLNV